LHLRQGEKFVVDFGGYSLFFSEFSFLDVRKSPSTSLIKARSVVATRRFAQSVDATRRLFFPYFSSTKTYSFSGFIVSGDKSSLIMRAVFG
jgi:hypothetical protein